MRAKPASAGAAELTEAASTAASDGTVDNGASHDTAAACSPYAQVGAVAVTNRGQESVCTYFHGPCMQ